MLQALLDLAGEFANATATKDGFELTVPYAVWERLCLNAPDFRRYALSISKVGEPAALFMPSPCGIITIRRSPP